MNLDISCFSPKESRTKDFRLSCVGRRGHLASFLLCRVRKRVNQPLEATNLSTPMSFATSIARDRIYGPVTPSPTQHFLVTHSSLHLISYLVFPFRQRVEGQILQFAETKMVGRAFVRIPDVTHRTLDVKLAHKPKTIPETYAMAGLNNKPKIPQIGTCIRCTVYIFMNTISYCM